MLALEHSCRVAFSVRRGLRKVPELPVEDFRRCMTEKHAKSSSPLSYESTTLRSPLGPSRESSNTEEIKGLVYPTFVLVKKHKMEEGGMF